MHVKVAMDDATITLDNNGVTFTIAAIAGKHIGHVRIGQATVEWRKVGEASDGHKGAGLRISTVRS